MKARWHIRTRTKSEEGSFPNPALALGHAVSQTMKDGISRSVHEGRWPDHLTGRSFLVLEKGKLGRDCYQVLVQEIPNGDVIVARINGLD